jgi:hypothetical protein
MVAKVISKISIERRFSKFFPFLGAPLASKVMYVKFISAGSSEAVFCSGC